MDVGIGHDSAVAVVPLLPDKRWRMEMEMGDGQMELGPPCRNRTVTYHSLAGQTVPHRKTIPYHHGQEGQYMQVPGWFGAR